MSRFNLTSCSLILVLMSLVTGLSATAAQVQRTQSGTPYLCWSNDVQPEKSTVYHTNVFTVAPGTSLGTLTNAWNNHLRGIYSPKIAAGSCDQQRDSTPIRDFGPMEATWRARKEQIVIVDWKYMPGQDTTPPAEPTQTGSNSSKPFYCSAGVDMTRYFSATFMGPEHLDVNRVRDDFAGYLKGKYSLSSVSAGCSSEDKNKEVAQFKESHRPIVETGWKPQSLPEKRRGPP